jgi:hypothetical protein
LFQLLKVRLTGAMPLLNDDEKPVTFARWYRLAGPGVLFAVGFFAAVFFAAVADWTWTGTVASAAAVTPT